MKIALVDKKNDRELYTYDSNTHKVNIADQGLKSIMKNTGILVPPKYSKDKDSAFYGKDRVKLEDGDQETFHEAFMKFYFPSNYDKAVFGWKAQ